MKTLFTVVTYPFALLAYAVGFLIGIGRSSFTRGDLVGQKLTYQDSFDGANPSKHSTIYTLLDNKSHQRY